VFTGVCDKGKKFAKQITDRVSLGKKNGSKTRLYVDKPLHLNPLKVKNYVLTSVFQKCLPMLIDTGKQSLNTNISANFHKMFKYL